MSEGQSGVLVLDATVLSNFASTDSVEWLVGSVSQPLTPRAVVNELEEGVSDGHDFLRAATDAISADRIEVCTAGALEGDGSSPVDLPDLDAGERAVVRSAAARSAVVATDDDRARTVAKTLDLRVTGSLGLLVTGVEGNDLDLDTANAWLERWIDEYHYYSPVDSIQAALRDE